MFLQDPHASTAALHGAETLGANGLIILTDGGGIWENFGKPNAREMKRVTPAYLTGVKAGAKFPGSMGPKITAAIDFVVNSERPDAWAAIADLKDAAKVFTNEEGTMISKDIGGGDVIWHATPTRVDLGPPPGPPLSKMVPAAMLSSTPPHHT